MNKEVKMHRKASAEITAHLSQMIDKLMDDYSLQRWGTSIQINMGREYQVHLDQKYDRLKIEFDKINKDTADDIRLDELIEFLNSYEKETGKKFSLEFAEKLFSLIDIDKNKSITVHEFVISYMLLEEKLRLKKIKLQKQIEDVEITNAKVEKGMRENEDEIIVNGISKQAILSVSILEAKDLKPQENLASSDPYCVLDLDGNKLYSSFQTDTIAPIWNEDFSFHVKDLNTKLRIDICNKDVDVSEAYIEIPLNLLRDQQSSVRWHSLLEGEHKIQGGQIRLKTHMIWSRFKFFQDEKIKCENTIEKCKTEIVELDKYFDLFQKPYGIILYGEIDEIIEAGLHKNDFDQNLYNIENARRSVMGTSPKQKFAGQFAMTVDNIIKGTFHTSLQWSKLSEWLMYAIVILSCLNCLDRTDFVNLFVGVVLWILFVFQKKNENILDYLWKVLVLILITMVYDFLWLTLHYSGYWGDSKYEKPEQSLKRISYFFSFLNFVCKIIISISLWISYVRAKNRKSTNYTGNINNRFQMKH